jgi:hypothetical protein
VDGEAENAPEPSGAVAVAGATFAACFSRSSRGASVRLEQPTSPLINTAATHSPRKLRDSFMRPFRRRAMSQATRVVRIEADASEPSAPEQSSHDGIQGRAGRLCPSVLTPLRGLTTSSRWARLALFYPIVDGRRMDAT